MNHLKTIDILTDYFAEGCKGEETGKLGVEAEHFIVREDTLEAVPYSGEGGIREVLVKLMDVFPEAVPLDGDDLFGFAAKDFTITLEPAAQLEISIAPERSICCIGEIYRDFIRKLESITATLGYRILNAGGQVKSRVQELELIPKQRYYLMDKHFLKTGTGGREMMRGTASVQVSVDYASEEDFRRKIQAAYYYSPMLKLFMDNTRTFEGKPVRGFLKRTDIWNRVDPARCGILPGIFREDYGFRDYAAFLCGMPLIFLDGKEEKTYTGFQTVEELYEGKVPDHDEILHILSMAFPDVRLKQFLEIRSADCVPYDRMMGYCALIKGMIYSETARDEVQRRIREGDLSEDDIRRTEESFMEKGWGGSFYGMPARTAAAEILALAETHLTQDEAQYLDAFRSHEG